MQLTQLQVSNDRVEDRLVLRIATQANEEFRVFFTRRFLRELWPHLTTLLASHLDANPGQSSSSEASSQTSSFDQPFQEGSPTYPLGSTPLLASEASFENVSEGVTRLTLREGRERSFHLNLSTELLQAFCAMLRAAGERAEWDLTLHYDRPTPHPQAAGKSSFLH